MVTSHTGQSTGRGILGRHGGTAATSALSGAFVVAWSSGFVGGRLGTQVASTPTLMVWRFVLVAIGLALVVVLLRRRRRAASTPPRPQGYGAHVAIGLLGQGVYIGANVGAIELGVAPGTAALVAALQPLLAGALAGPLLGEPVRPRRRVGLGLGLVGVVLVVGVDVHAGAADVAWWAYGLPFLGMVALVAATVIERRTSAARTPVLEALAVQTTASAVLFGMWALLAGAVVPPVDRLGSFALAVAWFIGLSTLGAYGLYWLTLRRTDITHLSSLIYLTPPTTMLWAWLMFGDPIEPQAWLGLGVCVVAVGMVVGPSRR